jgi:hypothetical protein
MKKKPGLFSCVLCVVILVSGCTSLKPVSELSSQSQKNLAIFEEINTTYTSFCQSRCQFELIRTNEIVRDSSVACDCSLFSAADKATSKLFRAIDAYFNSLGNLSKGDLTTYNTKALNEALIEGKFASLTIDKNTVTAYSSLGKLILQAFSEGYRKRKLSNVIESANAPLQTLLQAFETSVDNLSRELDFEKERYFALYGELIREEELTGYDKVSLANDYYSELKSIGVKQVQLKAFTKSLNTIASGHQKLFENRNKLTTSDIKILLTDYSASLKDLIGDFKKL